MQIRGQLSDSIKLGATFHVFGTEQQNVFHWPQHDTKDTVKVDDRAHNISNVTNKNIYTARVSNTKHGIANIWSR